MWNLFFSSDFQPDTSVNFLALLFFSPAHKFHHLFHLLSVHSLPSPTLFNRTHSRTPLALGLIMDLHNDVFVVRYRDIVPAQGGLADRHARCLCEGLCRWRRAAGMKCSVCFFFRNSATVDHISLVNRWAEEPLPI